MEYGALRPKYKYLLCVYMSALCRESSCGSFCNLKIHQMKLSKLIFMVRFIKVLEQVWPIEEGATARLVPMKAAEDAQKINEDYHKV